MSTTDPYGLWENSRESISSALHCRRLSPFQVALEAAGLLQLTTRVNLQLCAGNTPGYDLSIACSTAPHNQFGDIQQ